MARRLNVTDGYAFINTVASEMLGENATITAIDASSFASVGESILASGIENVLNTLALVASRDLVAIRPYRAKFRIMNELDSGMFSNRIRKISYFAKGAVPTGASNTQLFAENLAMDADNGVHYDTSTPPVQMSTESMWLQSTPVVWQSYFGGAIEWQYPYTLYENALKEAFRSPEEFTEFLNGFMVSCANDIETEKEAFSRALVLNAIAGVIDMSADMPNSAVNMRTAFNTRFGTSYTSAQLMTTYFSEFVAFFISTVKTLSDKLENRSTLFHWSPTKTVNGVSYYLPRQTKKDDQRMMMISSFWNDAEALVMPAIFNDQYLTDPAKQFEKVDYWQNINEPMKISVTPAIPDTSDPTTQISGSAVSLNYVLGIIYDRDAMMTDFHLENVATTPLEARKHYRTVWNTINKNPIWDPTENFIVLYLAD